MKKIALIIVMMLGSLSGTAQAQDLIYTSWKNNDAVGGYDVVSFYSGKPRNGQDMFSYEYLGVTWYFSSQANLDLFKTSPETFVPQYGGHCAWAAASGKLAKGSPKYWHVEDGRLYLNFNGRIQKRWDKDRSDFIQKADEAWMKISAKLDSN